MTLALHPLHDLHGLQTMAFGAADRARDGREVRLRDALIRMSPGMPNLPCRVRIMLMLSGRRPARISDTRPD